MTTMNPYHRALSTGVAGASFADKTATLTKPVSTTGIHVIDLASDATPYKLDTRVPKYIDITPIVGDADGETGTFRVWAWNRLTISSSAVYWVPKYLAGVTATATDAAVPAAIDAATTPFYCDTIVVNTGDPNALVISAGLDTVASLRLHIQGAELVEIDWNLGTGASQNFLYRFMDQ